MEIWVVEYVGIISVMDSEEKAIELARGIFDTHGWIVRAWDMMGTSKWRYGAGR